jgi:hypothetical protein
VLYLIGDENSDTLSVSEVREPASKNDMLDDYLRAMFNVGDEADRKLSEYHNWWDARGASRPMPKTEK